MGSGKAKRVKIPKDVIRAHWKIKSRCLKGIADSHGSFFRSDKGYRRDNPTIEITTISKDLAMQIKAILEDRDFRVGFRDWVPREDWNTRYIISINGDEMYKKWIGEIGFSNPRHHQKLNKI
ncbi:hypothetical protein AKJ64_00680 [candidate division MSBL1 archaeon SCGC-AAA259E17]|uniref:DOD-type homing endonuclease domain-containing protein n=1 Tax=candidate division MSBL1 archaeon SCGC-AAA259E17 TaxID=1698263 RepID=A0A133UGR8_9EURY|nr:hypothetical protein AKJ64_00680 [candidate division MSBL1 archaeon SCGC-AAA259E17]